MNNVHTILMHFPHHIRCRAQKLFTGRKESEGEDAANATVAVTRALLTPN